jgi:hypothetical protein
MQLPHDKFDGIVKTATGASSVKHDKVKVSRPEKLLVASLAIPKVPLG